MTDLHSKLNSYGVSYEGAQEPWVEPDIDMTLTELSDAKGKIVKVRFIGDVIPGHGRCFDLSYIQGELPDGRRVSLINTPHIALVPRRQLKGEMINWAKREGVFAKGIGLLDDSNWSLLG